MIQDYSGKQVWSFRWTNSQGGGNLTVNVDTSDGTIREMYRWLPPGPNKRGGLLPKLSRAQARDLALAFIRRLEPAKADQLKAVDPTWARPEIRYDPRSEVLYYFEFVRLANGIPFPENRITMNIDSDTGEVTHYGLQWDNLTFPPPAGAISPKVPPRRAHRSSWLTASKNQGRP